MLVLLVVLQCRLRGSRLGLAVDRLETEVLYLIKTEELKAGRCMHSVSIDIQYLSAVVF